MSIVNTTECIICYNEYDTETRRPCIGTCGHSICENCTNQIVSSKCPQCNREEAFAITTINYQVLELVKHFKSLKTDVSPGQLSIMDDTKSLVEGTCCECTLRSRKLQLCIRCAVQAGVFWHDVNRKEFVLNVENNDVESALQKVKKIAICSDCALDGSRHEDHIIMELAVLKNNLELREHTTDEEKVNALKESASYSDQVAVEQLLCAWTPGGRMPNPKSNYAAASNKSKIFIVGGMHNGTWLQSVEMYDRKKNMWRDGLHKWTCCESISQNFLSKTVEEKLNTMKEKGGAIFEDLRNKFDNMFSSLNAGIKQYAILNNTTERKINFNIMKESIGKFNKTFSCCCPFFHRAQLESSDEELVKTIYKFLLAELSTLNEQSKIALKSEINEIFDEETELLKEDKNVRELIFERNGILDSIFRCLEQPSENNGQDLLPPEKRAVTGECYEIPNELNFFPNRLQMVCNLLMELSSLHADPEYLKVTKERIYRIFGKPIDTNKTLNVFTTRNITSRVLEILGGSLL